MFDILVYVLVIVCIALLLYVGYRFGYYYGFKDAYDNYVGVYKDKETLPIK